MLIFEKELTQSERERHWIRVPVITLSKFPSFGEVFEIKAKSEKVHAKIDRYHRLLGIGEKAFIELGLEKPGSIAIIEKNPTGDFVLRSKSKTA